MQINKTSVVHAFCGWFDIVFDVKGGTSVSFSTSCEGTQTHWKQTVFVLESPMHVTAGDIVSGDLKCSKNKDNHRELDVVITWSCGSYSATQKYQVR